MKLFSFLLILGGLAFVRSAVRGTKPSSTVLWGKDSAGKPMKTAERISWALLGAGVVILGVFQLFSDHSN